MIGLKVLYSEKQEKNRKETRRYWLSGESHKRLYRLAQEKARQILDINLEEKKTCEEEEEETKESDGGGASEDRGKLGALVVAERLMRISSSHS